MKATLFKHEILRTWRWLALLTLAALLAIGATVLMAATLPSVVSVIFAGIALIVATCYPYVVQVLISLDFYRSSYSKIGYFTAAIPVRGSTIFGVKSLYAYLVSLVAMVLGLGLLLLASIGFGMALGTGPAKTMRVVADGLAAFWQLPGWLTVAIIVIAAFLPLAGIAPFFFAATVGSESWINRSGFGGVVLVWFLFYLASQVIGAAVFLLVPSLDLSRLPELSLMFDPVALMTADDDALYLPLGVFAWMPLMGAIGMWWAKVSYSRKLELR